MYSDLWGFVGNDGREYVVLNTLAGTAWYDVDDPIHPVFLNHLMGPVSGWRDCFDIGDFVYVATEGGGGIQIVDVSVPSNPTTAGNYDATVDNAHNIFGDRARLLLYVVRGAADGANGGLQILDASNPTSLVEVGRWTNQYVHDVSTEGTVIHANLIIANRFRLIDASVPSNPISLGNALNDPTGANHSSWPIGDGVHVLILNETTGGGVKTLDVSNPAAIALVGTFNPAPATIPHNVHVQGSIAAVSWYTRGTRILSIGDPTNLAELGFLDTYPQNDAGLPTGNWGTFPHFPSGLIASSDIFGGLFLMRYEPNCGSLEGTILSSSGGVVQGARVVYTNLSLAQTTTETGRYEFAGFSGLSQTIEVSAFGFQPSSATVVLAPNGTTTTDITLTKLPSGGVQGTVRDATTLLPIELVEVSLVGTPLRVVTGTSGSYAFPSVPFGAHALSVLRYGHSLPVAPIVEIEAGTVKTIDFSLDPAPIYEDFATPAGWTVTNEPATVAGTWVFGEPVGTFGGGQSFQPEHDHTLDPEQFCAITGNASTGGIDQDDVDGGATRLRSPVFDLSAMALPHVLYHRWYVTLFDSPPDQWTAEMTDDGGASWQELESTTTHEPEWICRDFDLTDRLSSWETVQFRFTVQDQATDQVVEAALDDFTIYDAAHGSTSAPDSPGRRESFELSQNHPNPFSTSTSIRFSIPEVDQVELTVFDVAGRRIAVLLDGVQEVGPHEVGWDGLDSTGRRVGSGVFFCELEVGGEVRVRKMLRIE